MTSEHPSAIKVWDAWIRLFHWTLVLLFAFQIYSGNTGGNILQWHMYAGYAVLALVLFRVAWGFAGSSHARFASFVAGPGKTAGFARKLFSRAPASVVGHNPVGGWMVLALLASLALQAGTGLFANDDIATEGPLAVLVSRNLSSRLTSIHRWNAYVLIALASLHVAAIVFHRIVKNENLVAAMITGIQRVPPETAQLAATARFVGAWRAVTLLAAALAAVYLLVRLPSFL
jgi:cytochrome b